MSQPPLVILYKQLGDVLLLEPALAMLAETYGTDVVLATRPEFSPMLSLMDRVKPLPPGPIRRASRVISFDSRSRACIQTLRTLAPEKRLIVPAEKQLRGWHRHVFPSECRVEDASTLYRAEYYFRALPESKGRVFRPPKLALPSPDGSFPRLPDRYVLVHPTSAWKRKCWSAGNWGKALTAMHDMGLGPFVLTGGNAEWEQAFVAEIVRNTEVPLVNLCGKTGLAGYMGSIAGARMVLSIDGSAAHLAAAFQRPSVALFGPTHALHWHLPAEHSLLVDARRFAQEERPAVDSIPVDAVVEASRRLWEMIR